eukprot:SAG31_NODE_2181_length_6246_cov_12.867252_5_plen_150_part_00
MLECFACRRGRTRQFSQKSSTVRSGARDTACVRYDGAGFLGKLPTRQEPTQFVAANACPQLARARAAAESKISQNISVSTPISATVTTGAEGLADDLARADEAYCGQGEDAALRQTPLPWHFKGLGRTTATRSALAAAGASRAATTAIN